MILVIVHGISSGLDDDWSNRWLSMIRPHVNASVIDVMAISWERVHESSYDPARSNRENLLQDLGALTNSAVLNHLTDRLRALEHTESTVWIIAHSLGSALAYQALDWLQLQGSPLFVRRFITIGSPLWIPYSRTIRYLSFLNVAMARARKLVNVHHWFNLAGRFDPIAGCGLVRLPMAHYNFRCWCRHPFEHYAEKREFRKILEMP